MSALKDAWRIFTGRNIQLRSLKVAVVVGSVLNVINQGAEILRFDANLIKIALTFCVPYCVPSYGAVTALLDTGSAGAAGQSGGQSAP